MLTERCTAISRNCARISESISRVFTASMSDSETAGLGTTFFWYLGSTCLSWVCSAASSCSESSWVITLFGNDAVRSPVSLT